MSEFVAIMQVYAGSDGEATRALYARLGPHGPAGGYRGRAYEKKQWSLDNVAAVLAEHAEALGIRWGWKLDPQQPFHKWVVYVDLPAGQVSFHAAERGRGPDYPGEWDQSREQGPTRICRYVQAVLAGAP